MKLFTVHTSSLTMIDIWPRNTICLSIFHFRRWRHHLGFHYQPDSLVICACWSWRVPLMRALKSVIEAMLVERQSISSSIFLKSFFIFLIVSSRRRWWHSLIHHMVQYVHRTEWDQHDPIQQHDVQRIAYTIPYCLTCGRDELVVVLIHQCLHVTVQGADLLDHAGLLVHQLSKGTFSPELQTPVGLKGQFEDNRQLLHYLDDTNHFYIH